MNSYFAARVKNCQAVKKTWHGELHEKKKVISLWDRPFNFPVSSMYSREVLELKDDEEEEGEARDWSKSRNGVQRVSWTEGGQIASSRWQDVIWAELKGRDMLTVFF